MAGALQNQVAVVTGAGRGIGRAIALALAQAGARVVLGARTLEQLQNVCNEIHAAGGVAYAVPVDLGDEQSIRAFFAAADQQAGPVDILINNAGIGLFGPVATFASADFDRVMQINLRGTFLCSQQAIQRMQVRQRGSIINVASVVGIKGYVNQAAYSASKHGVMGLTKVMAAELQKQNIRVSVVLPGGVDTDMVGDARPDLKRDELLQSSDIADAVMYLLTLPARAAVDQIYIRRRNSAPF